MRIGDILEVCGPNTSFYAEIIVRNVQHSNARSGAAAAQPVPAMGRDSAAFYAGMSRSAVAPFHIDAGRPPPAR